MNDVRIYLIVTLLVGAADHEFILSVNLTHQSQWAGLRESSLIHCFGLLLKPKGTRLLGLLGSGILAAILVRSSCPKLTCKQIQKLQIIHILRRFLVRISGRLRTGLGGLLLTGKIGHYSRLYLCINCDWAVFMSAS